MHYVRPRSSFKYAARRAEFCQRAIMCFCSAVNLPTHATSALNFTGVNVQGIQNRFGMLFFMMLFLSLMSLSSLPIWAEDMLLFFRERDSGAYSTSPYFLARVLFDVLPLRAVPPLLFTLITYPAAGLHSNSGSCVAWFTVTLVAGNTAASLLCMCLGALLPSLTLANMVRPSPIHLSSNLHNLECIVDWNAPNP